MVNPENIYTSNIIQSEQVIFGNICIYTYVDIIRVDEKESMNWRESKEGVHGTVWMEKREGRDAIKL